MKIAKLMIVMACCGMVLAGCDNDETAATITFEMPAEDVEITAGISMVTEGGPVVTP